MSTWVPVPRPSAKLTMVDSDEVTEEDGRMTLLFRTDHGAYFLRITEPSGFVYWLQKVVQS